MAGHDRSVSTGNRSPAMNPFPIERVRAQFPALSGDNGDTIFFDNPAGTQVPQRVIEAVAEAMTRAASNLGGAFSASRHADEIWDEAHRAMADFLGAGSGREVVIGPSMTGLTMQMSRVIGRTLAPGDEIIVTQMDHEGNISPWLHLAEDRSLTVKWLDFDRDTWRIEPDDLSALLSERTRLVALTFASNLTGSINEVKKLAALARQAGSLVYVDAVQFAPHGLVDVATLGADFLVCSSYKFFGPHLGILWGREELLHTLEPYGVRCGPKDLPGRHENGTPQSELLAGLAATVDYFAWLGAQVGADAGAGASRRGAVAAAYGAARAHEAALSLQLIEGLKDMDLVIHGITNSNRIAERVPTVSATHLRHTPQALAQGLADSGICVWSGHNYAYEVVKALGLDERQGVLRIGLAHYNTPGEVDRALAALGKLLN
jgi:cysteine desulfurase family protein (TIGR01976 family)